MPRDRFRRPSTRMPSRHQGVVEDRNDPVLQIVVQVDQQVAAGDQVDAGERRVADQAVGGEGAEFADFLADGEAVLAFDEVARPPLRATCPPASVAGKRPARAVPIATSSMSLAKICTFGTTEQGRPCARAAGWRANRLPHRWRSPAPKPAGRWWHPCRRTGAGMTSCSSASKVAASRKKLVTLISRSRNSSTACSRSVFSSRM